MEYFISTGCWGELFAVPDAVVDKYIKLASGSAIKVLLYILRNSNKPVSKSEISAALNISDDDVNDAFTFWKEVKILNQSASAAPSPETASEKKSAAKVQEKTQNTVSERTKSPDTPETQSYIQRSSSNFHITPSELTAKKESSKEIQNMFDIAQQTLGNMINHTILKSLLWQHEYLGLNIDVILTLLQYCSSIGKASAAYIETIAINWSTNNINTFTKAQNEVQRMTELQNFAHKVSSAFGLKRAPTPNQQKFIDEWSKKGFSTDLISCACERTIDLNKALTMNYVNAILVNWSKEGITTREAAEATFGKGSYYNSSSGKTEQSYNISEFDKLAVTFSGNIIDENTDKKY